MAITRWRWRSCLWGGASPTFRAADVASLTTSSGWICKEKQRETQKRTLNLDHCIDDSEEMKRAADEQVRFFFWPKTRAQGPVVGIICTDNRHSCRKQKMGKWSRKKARIPSNGQVNTSCAPARTQNHCGATKIYQLGRFSHWLGAGSQGGQICHILSPQIKSSNARFFPPWLQDVLYCV